jgi:hypothetical protein
LGMGVLLVMQPQSSVSRWQGRSTAGPSHYRTQSWRAKWSSAWGSTKFLPTRPWLAGAYGNHESGYAND